MLYRKTRAYNYRVVQLVGSPKFPLKMRSRFDPIKKRTKKEQGGQPMNKSNSLYIELINEYNASDLLCKHCIDAIRSRGERVYNCGAVLDIDDAMENGITCGFCDEFNTLYACKW